jgi:hypothetical protein
MKFAWSLLLGLSMLGNPAGRQAQAFEVLPFTGIGPDASLVNGLQHYWLYPSGPSLFLTTEEGFHSYDFDSEQWIDHTWPGWIGKAKYAVTPVPGYPDRLALGGVNAWFKGTLLLSDDGGATEELVHESAGGRVCDMALVTDPDTVIFACTWSDVVDGELLRSDDGGQTYTPISGHGQHHLTAVEATSSTEIYVSGDNYVTRSLDGGLTWENLQANLPVDQVLHCLLVPWMVTGLPDRGTAPGSKTVPEVMAGLLLAGNDSGVYISSAHEIDWQQILPIACRSLAYRFVQVDTFVFWSEYYAVTLDGRLMVCLGQNWNNWVDATEMMAPAVPVAVTTRHGPVYVATQDHGVFVSWGIDGASPVPPSSAALHLKARPNPFNPVTQIMFDVPVEGPAIIEVFDLAGRKVDTVYEGNARQGLNTVSWQPRDLASGVYHALLRQGEARATVRVSLVK